jgi:hypothetical protein
MANIPDIQWLGFIGNPMEKRKDNSLESEPIELSLLTTLDKSNLTQIPENILELSIDTILEQGILREIPVISTLAGLIRIGMGVREHLFLKKLLVFLQQLADIEPTIRGQMISRLENHPKDRRRIGENLLLLLERLDRVEKSEMVGRAFRAYCNGAIDRQTLERVTTAIDRIVLIDLPQLRRFCLEWKTSPFDAEVQQNFINAGLAISQSFAGGSSAVPTALCRLFIEHVLGEKLESLRI